MLKLVGLVFAVIEGLLTLRMLLPLFTPPAEAVRFLPLFRDVTDALMAPWAWLDLPFGGSGSFPGIGGQLDLSVLPALIGWGIVAAVVTFLLRALGVGRDRTVVVRSED